MHSRFVSTSEVSLASDGDFQHTQLVLLNIASRVRECVCLVYVCTDVCVQESWSERVCHDAGYQWGR